MDPGEKDRQRHSDGSLRQIRADGQIIVRLDEKKAAQWGRKLLVVTVSGHMQPTLAAKMAGRLQRRYAAVGQKQGESMSKLTLRRQTDRCCGNRFS